jgi:iron complex outermembrane recepter protein
MKKEVSAMNSAPARTRHDSVTSNAVSAVTRAGAVAIAVATALAGSFTTRVARADAEPLDEPLAEVVVTVQRRSENVQDVPTSITVFTPEQLGELRIEQTGDLAAYTPGLYVSTSQFGDPVFSLRGVGMNNANTNQNPAVTEYINEVALPSVAMLGFQLFDLERVEVLEGPQGDLYGRNTTGGAINFITARPTQQFSSSVDVNYGNFNLTEIGAEIGGGVTDNLAVRFAAHAISRDGWQTDVASNNEGGYTESKNGAIDRQAARFSALWTPSDTFQALFVGDASFDDSEVPAYKDMGYTNPNGTCAVPQVSGFNGGKGCPSYAVPTPNSAPVAVADASGDPTVGFGANSYGNRNDVHLYGGSLKMDWTLNGMTLTSVTGAREMNRSMGSSSGSPYIDQDMLRVEDLKTFSQEVRLASNGASALTWLVGAYYSHDDDSDRSLYNYAQNYEVAPLSSTPVIFNEGISQRTETEALFGHAEYELTNEWKVVAGIRETHEDIDYTYASGVNVDFPPADELTPVPYDHATLSSNGLSGKLGLNYQPSKDLLVYLTLSEGYKAGGFPGDIAFLPYPAGQPASAYLPSYASEKLFAYELGSKATFADGMVVFNNSIYYYDWRNMQASTEIPYGTPPNTIEVFSLGNAGNAKIYGLDSDLTLRMTRELTLRAGLNLMDSKIVSGIYQDETPVQSPRASTNLVLRYEALQPLGSTLPFAQVDYNYRSAVFFTLPNDWADHQGGYGLLGARVGLKTADSKWEYSAWARNLTNTQYLVDAFGAGSTFLPDRHLYAEPRTFGLNVKYSY